MLHCTSITLVSPTCHQASQQVNTYWKKYQKADRAITLVTLWDRALTHHQAHHVMERVPKLCQASPSMRKSAHQCSSWASQPCNTRRRSPSLFLLIEKCKHSEDYVLYRRPAGFYSLETRTRNNTLWLTSFILDPTSVLLLVRRQGPTLPHPVHDALHNSRSIQS